MNHPRKGRPVSLGIMEECKLAPPENSSESHVRVYPDLIFFDPGSTKRWGEQVQNPRSNANEQ